ncbi:hypothetical protein [uncultured Clostridium sp.]|uniref:hypothetical protein n=1 Tax=uncultured Clostridium sp. TaxID=59620 RepID=UPI002603D8A9|nr:hypothetical protein [uncultured Clostridium sp.]
MPCVCSFSAVSIFLPNLIIDEAVLVLLVAILSNNIGNPDFNNSAAYQYDFSYSPT